MRTVLTVEDASLLALEYNVNPIIANTESLFDLTPQYVFFERGHRFGPMDWTEKGIFLYSI